MKTRCLCLCRFFVFVFSLCLSLYCPPTGGDLSKGRWEISFHFCFQILTKDSVTVFVNAIMYYKVKGVAITQVTITSSTDIIIDINITTTATAIITIITIIILTVPTLRWRMQRARWQMWTITADLQGCLRQLPSGRVIIVFKCVRCLRYQGLSCFFICVTISFLLPTHRTLEINVRQIKCPFHDGGNVWITILQEDTLD